jgi:hypothetical protein
MGKHHWEEVLELNTGTTMSIVDATIGTAK